MIKNEKQYRISKGKLKKFNEALDLIKKADNNGIHPLLIKAQIDSIDSQIEEFKHDISEYENLKTGKVTRFITSIGDLSKGIINSRIARGYNHEELGRKLGVSAQQIQKYEAENYLNTSLKKLIEVISILDVDAETEFNLEEKSIHPEVHFLIPDGYNAELIQNKITNRGTTVEICI
ncbi:helix-turn-helix transcriptional regulator [Psychroserpens sp. AS72]|uniref:helix-turn-helix transcriptional regulator n=1 Tax=Psychroserpens sp. AS72 TaxID=3135775 RepID=UPI003180DD1A